MEHQLFLRSKLLAVSLGLRLIRPNVNLYKKRK